MPDVRLKTRIQNKYKTLNEWNEIAAGDFIPLKGEVCYAVDGNMVFQKIGDGFTDFTELKWLLSPSVQSDHAENDEQSFAYIKNRLGYAYEKELSVEEGLLGTLSDLMVQQLTKEEIRFLIDQFAASGDINTEGLDTTLPEDIASYYIIQTGQGDDDYNALTKPLTENFCIRFKSGDEVFDINSKDCLISQYTQYREPYTLIMEGSARLANIWLRMADIQAPLYDISINPDKKYTMISLINNNDLSSLTALLCDATMYDYLGNTTDIVFFENVKEAVQPIDSKYLIEAQSNYDEMDSSNASYIYNRYGNISTGTVYVSNSNPASPYIGQVVLDKPATLGRPNYNRFEFTENVCNSELDFYAGEVAYDTFKVTINGEVFEQSPIFYGKELLAPGTIQDILTYIGNPKFLSDVYSILGEGLSDGKTADNADNGLPFLLTFDFNSFPALVNCILDLPYAEGDDLLIQVNPQAQSLAKKVIPKELLPECGCPWVYNEDKQSLMSPTAYEASGVASFSTGMGTAASGPYTTAIGNKTQASQRASIATGIETNASGAASFTQGGYTKASKIRSAALGYKTWSNGANALTIGDNTYATGTSAFAGGQGSTAAGMGSVTFAQGSYVSGNNSTAFGYGLLDDISDSVEGAIRPSTTTIQISAIDYDYDWCSLWSYCLVSGATTETMDVATIKKITQSGDTITLTLDREVDVVYTDFEFYKATRVEGNNSFSMGSGNLIKEDSTIALGDGLTSTYGYQAVIGQYNVDDDKAFIIGQGEADNNRKNIFSVDREGNVEATNFVANYVNKHDEKIVISLSEIPNLITRIESLENEEPYIPQKGVDYFTESDKQEIVNNIIEYFGGSPILGYVDENNNIIITSDLENGTYIFKYEESNGAYANIGNLTIGNIISYSITNSLVGCSADINNTSIINENETITLKYIADEGFVFDTTISVNGASYTWDAITGILVLSNPTENVTVIITATKDGYTNIIDTVGYSDGYRLSSSSGEFKELEGYTTTGLFTVPAQATIRTKGVNFNYKTGTCNIGIWKNGDFITATTLYETSGVHDTVWNGFTWSLDDEGNLTLNYSSNYKTDIKICGYGNGENLIVTINEEIVD